MLQVDALAGGVCKGAKAVRLLAAQLFRAISEGKALQALEFEPDKARLSPEMQEKLLLLATSAINANKQQLPLRFNSGASRVEVSNSWKSSAVSLTSVESPTSLHT